MRREIEIDEDTDRMLTELASEYAGDLGLALAELVRAHEGLEEFADRGEEAREAALRAMRHRSEADSRGGRTSGWEDVKANGAPNATTIRALGAAGRVKGRRPISAAALFKDLGI